MGTEYQHMVEVYQAALNLWQQKRLVEAEQMLQVQAQTGSFSHTK